MSERWDRRDWLILLGLGAFAALVFSRVLFTRDWSFGVELDFLRQFYPARVFEAKSLAEGTFPLWSPYILSGHPFFASFQTAMLYPLNLLMVGIYGAAGAEFPLQAQNTFVVFHFFLAGAFTYLLARDLKVGRAGATVAALTFMFSGFMAAHAGHMNQHSAAAWIPLVFLLFNRALTLRRFSYAFAAGVALGVALLAGHVQSVFYFCAVLLGYVLFTAVRRRGDPTLPGLGYGLAALAATVVVGAGLAAVQLIPTYELIGLSTRSKVPYDVAVTASLPRWQAVNLVFPHFFGSTPEGYTGGWLMWETYGYCGIVGGALGVIALLKKPRGFAVFLWITAGLSIILAVGPAGYLWTALFKLGLFVNRFRDPARVLVIFAFASALLAGLGADYLVKSIKEKGLVRYRSAARLALILAALVLALVLALSIFLAFRGPGREAENRTAFKAMIVPTSLMVAFAGLLLIAGRLKTGRTWLSTGIVLLVALDLVLMNVTWIMTPVEADDLYGDRRASEYVARMPGEFRVETDANTMYSSLDNGAVFGLEKASGDDSLVLEDYFRYRGLLAPQQAPGVQVGLFYEGGITSELLDVMNVEYLMTRGRIPPSLARGKFDEVTVRDGVRVYRNRAAMPRAWMSDCLAFETNQDVYEHLVKTRGEGLREQALVVYPPAFKTQGPGAEPVSLSAVKGEVRVSSRSAHRLTLKTDPSCKGLLAVSEIDYPGWEAYVDGKKAGTLRTDLIFRGVMLAGGQREVEFRFRPASLRAGVLVSLVTAALVAAWFLVLMIRKLLASKKEGRA